MLIILYFCICMRTRLLLPFALLLVAVLCPASLRAQVRQTNPFTDSLTFTPPNSGYGSAITSAFRLGDHLLLNGGYTASRLPRPRSSNTTGIWFVDVRTGEELSGTPFHAVVGPDSAGKTTSVPTPGDGLIAYRKGELVWLASDASVQDRWALSANGDVSGMRLHGDTLFLFGGFTRIAGQERRGVVAVKLAGREVLPFAINLLRPYQEAATVRELKVRGDRVFVSGDYVLVNGSLREGVLALDRNTGAVLPWQTAGGAIQARLFHSLDIIGCKTSDAAACGRYDYDNGALVS